MAASALPATTEMSPNVAERVRQDRLRARMLEIVGRLEADAKERVGKRDPIEKRWIEDLQQYHGRYDSTTEARLNKLDASKIYIPMTRPKTEAMEARLMDLLFPTDDRNWGIKPTPVPDLIQSARMLSDEMQQAQEAKKQAEAQGDQQAAAAAGLAAEEARRRKAALDAEMAVAKRAGEAMELEIEDQLVECRYHAVNRDMIHDACKLGTGVLKGPVVGLKARQGWKRQPVVDPMTGQPALDPQTGRPIMGDYALDMGAGDRPGWLHVDLWNFFPDMDARNIHEGEGVFERHLYNKKKMRGLARLPGFDVEAVRRLLSDGPRGGPPSYLADLRNITASTQQITNDLYHVWEYNGPLGAEDMRDLALAMMEMAGEERREGFEAMAQELAEVDELMEVQASIWFCQNEVLKFALYPLDSGEPLYSVFNLFSDEASIFGYGIPYAIRHPQAMLNGAVRMLMDNGGLATGPQTVVDPSQIEPEDGNWNPTARKTWLVTDEYGTKNAPPFSVFQIPSNIGELLTITELALKFIDELSSLPMIAQGEQGPQPQQTAQGMSILMNSANVVFRRIVKNYDDDVTVPNLRRQYDWNMQFSPKQHIKGDFEVDARGSSVLLVREMQAVNAMAIIDKYGMHPRFGPMIQGRKAFQVMLKANMLSADEVMVPEDEHGAEQDMQTMIATIVQQMVAEAIKGAGRSGGKSEEEIAFEREKLEFEREKLDSAEAIAQMREDRMIEAELLRRDVAMMSLAEKSNLTLDQIDAQMEAKREAASLKRAELAQKDRNRAVEVAMAERTGVSSGGAV